MREALGKTADPAAAKAVAIAEGWVKDPSEANRRAAEAAANAAGYGTAAGSLAAAAFWSGGSIAPAKHETVPPKEELTGIAVAGAILLASSITASGLANAKRRFVALGAEVASGKIKAG